MEILKKCLVGMVAFATLSVAHANIFVNNGLDASVYPHALTPNISGTKKIHAQCVGIIEYTLDPVNPIAISYKTHVGRGCLVVIDSAGEITLSPIGTAECVMNGDILELTIPTGTTTTTVR